MKVLSILNAAIAIGTSIAYFGFDYKLFPYGFILAFYTIDQIHTTSFDREE